MVSNRTRTTRRQHLSTASALATVGAVAGCSGRGSSDGADNAEDNTGTKVGTAGESLTTVPVGIPHFGTWDLTVQLLVGKAQGFFEEEGLEVSRIDLSGGGSNVRAVQSGDAKVGFGTGIFSLFAAFREGGDIRIVSNEISSASDIVMFSKAGSKYEELRDCTDAKIGFSRPGSSTNMVALRAIEHANLEDAEAVSVGGPSDAFAAVKTDEIDVGWAIPFFSTPRIDSGEIQEVFTGDQIPPFDDLTIRVNFASQQWLQNNGDTARSFFRAWKRSTDWGYDNLDEAVELWAEMLDQDASPLKSAVETYYPKEALQLDRFRNFDAAMDLSVEHDFIDSPLSEAELSTLVTTEYLPSTEEDTYT